MNKFLSILSSSPILADGAMGTMLHARGIGFDQCFDELNLTNPAAVADIHKAYIDAGAQLILTNTFGANRYKLGKHGLESKVAEVNRAGVELARRAVAASFKVVLIQAILDLLACTLLRSAACSLTRRAPLSPSRLLPWPLPARILSSSRR
jgi:homocysteine S-methyltransferase